MSGFVDPFSEIVLGWRGGSFVLSTCFLRRSTRNVPRRPSAWSGRRMTLSWRLRMKFRMFCRCSSCIFRKKDLGGVRSVPNSWNVATAATVRSESLCWPELSRIPALTKGFSFATNFADFLNFLKPRSMSLMLTLTPLATAHTSMGATM